MKINFSKMHGLGNDFVIIDAVNQQVNLSLEQRRWIADRHRGIGCDQLILLENSQSHDFFYRIYNHDGSEAQQCGNAARCLAKFIKMHGLSQKQTITVETLTGKTMLRLHANGEVTVTLDKASTDPNTIPIHAKPSSGYYFLVIDSEPVRFTAISTGNPHAVIEVENIDSANVDHIGKQLSQHAMFPEQANIGFMQIIQRDRIRLRVFERGVGETQACGSGACAAVVAGQLHGLLDKQVHVELPGGQLHVTCEADQTPIELTGAATHVFEGILTLCKSSS